jgi:hypothetical protein
MIETELTPEQVQSLEDHLYEFNASAAGLTDGQGLAIRLRDELVLRQAIWRKTMPQWQICGIPGTFYTEYVPRNIFGIMWPFVLCGASTVSH